MTKEAVTKVVQRAISDGAFRRQLSNDPATALRGFDLAPNETAAIRSGDSGRLSALGIDVRMSKAFGLMGNDSVASVSTPADISTGSGALTPGDGAAGSAVLSTGENAGHQVVQWDGTDDQPLGGHNEVQIPGNPAHALDAQTPTDGAAGAPDDSDQYLTSVNTAQTAGDSASENTILIGDDASSGASSPGEAASGPNIQE